MDGINKKQPMPVLDAEFRRRCFFEVATGYTEEQALKEAARCISCKNMPCVSGCPVQINIPAFIKKIRELDFEGAYDIISQSSSLPAVCGRVCPQEKQCEAKCVRGIKGEAVGIGRLERFVADLHNERALPVAVPESNGRAVAVVGSGPAGLTCAGTLRRLGYDVTVFEALHLAGGVLVYGIPEFRLPKAIVKREIDTLKALGVRIETNVIIGKTLTVDELFEEGFQAVFIASGAGLPQFMGIEGESLKGVYSANEYLTRINLMQAFLPESDTPIIKGKHVAVVGGGNVAMDAARCALRNGAEKVYIVYRRSMDELPARKEEVEHAVEEGVEFMLLNNPTRIFGDDSGFVSGMELVKMELGEPDARGRRSPHAIQGSEHTITVDTVIMAIGTSPNPLIKATTPMLDTNERGGIIADELGKTSKAHVYAGGDAVTGAATVILAMGAGKTAAESIHKELSGN